MDFDQPNYLPDTDILFDKKMQTHGSLYWRKLPNDDASKIGKNEKTHKKYKRARNRRKQRKNKQLATYEQRFNWFYTLWRKEEDAHVSVHSKQQKDSNDIKRPFQTPKKYPLTFENLQNNKENECRVNILLTYATQAASPAKHHSPAAKRAHATTPVQTQATLAHEFMFIIENKNKCHRALSVMLGVTNNNAPTRHKDKKNKNQEEKNFFSNFVPNFVPHDPVSITDRARTHRSRPYTNVPTQAPSDFKFTSHQCAQVFQGN
jgi:hypothetical protein